jgi:hypothetical protein
MIYSPFHRSIYHFKNKSFKHISQWKKAPDTVFFYYELDYTNFNIPLANAFSLEQWQHLTANPESKLLIYFGGDYLNITDLPRLVEAIDKHNVNPKQVWFIVLDNNYLEMVRSKLPDVNIRAINHLLNSTKVSSDPADLEMPGIKEYRFSALSRNYKYWRLDFYLGLVLNHVLDKTLYSFHNVYPYNRQKPYASISEIQQDLSRLGYDSSDQLITNWVDSIPHDIPNGDVHDKWSDITYQTIKRANINILIESHFDPFEWDVESVGTDPRDYSPGFYTEKTYKAIACVRPFVAVSTPYFLEDLRKLGYKTFSPFINESYDTIVDNDERMSAVQAELYRIANLSNEEFTQLVEQCHEVAIHNYQCLVEHKIKTIPDREWKWFKSYLK